MKCQGCRACRKTNDKIVKEGCMHSVLRVFVNSAKARMKECHRKTGDIDLEDLKELFVAQRGLCAISGRRLELTGHWKASLERLDPREPYTRDNVSLICACLNIIDHTDRCADKGMLLQGLNKERWTEVMENLAAKKRADWRLNILGK